MLIYKCYLFKTIRYYLGRSEQDPDTFRFILPHRFGLNSADRILTIVGKVLPTYISNNRNIHDQYDYHHFPSLVIVTKCITRFSRLILKMKLSSTNKPIIFTTINHPVWLLNYAGPYSKPSNSKIKLFYLKFQFDTQIFVLTRNIIVSRQLTFLIEISIRHAAIRRFNSKYHFNRNWILLFKILIWHIVCRLNLELHSKSIIDVFTWYFNLTCNLSFQLEISLQVVYWLFHSNI